MTLTEKQARKWAELTGTDAEIAMRWGYFDYESPGVWSAYLREPDDVGQNPSDTQEWCWLYDRTGDVELWQKIPDYHTDDTALVDWLDLVVKSAGGVTFWADESQPTKTLREAAIAVIDEFCEK